MMHSRVRGFESVNAAVRVGMSNAERPSLGREGLTASATGCGSEGLRGKRPYFGGAGVKISRFWLGSGFGFGLGAFLASFLPLSLLPMSLV